MLRRPGQAIVWALVSIATALLAWLIYHANSGWAYDTEVYRMGGSIALHGSDLYAKSTPHPYTYPPFSALLFVPLALLPAGAASIAWTVLSVAGFIVVTWITLRWLHIAPALVEGRAWLLALTAIVCLATIWLDPIADTLLAGQVNLVVMALVLTDLLLPDGNRWKGIATGFAATFKLLPLFFVVYLLLTRRLAAAGRAILAFLATVAIGWVVLPHDSATYWGGTFLDSTRVGDAQNPRSESLLSLLVRWSHSTTSLRPLWLVLEIVVAIAILALALWAHRRGDEFLAICFVAAGTLFLSPITWRHHWVWILPIVLWTTAVALGKYPPPQGQGRVGVPKPWLWIPIGLIALDFYLRPYGGIPINPQTDLHLDVGQLIASSTHTGSLLVFIASAVAILMGSPPLNNSSTTRPRRQPLSEEFRAPM